MESSSETEDRKEADGSPERQASDAQGSGPRQAYGVQLPRLGDPALKALRGQSPPHYQGHRPWNASWLLISYLAELPLEGLRVTDVGCGWGIASTYCAQRGAQVTAVDIDPHVIPLVDMLGELNGVTVSTITAGFEEVDEELLAATDLLIGADICFRAPMIGALFGLLQRGLVAGMGGVAITDPGRIPYRDLAARCIADLGARECAWQTAEPLLAWPGERPRIVGRLLRMSRP